MGDFRILNLVFCLSHPVSHPYAKLGLEIKDIFSMLIMEVKQLNEHDGHYTMLLYSEIKTDPDKTLLCLVALCIWEI